jgi:ubiquinone/menaquinone biosynthesis C-methylase UbiE
MSEPTATETGYLFGHSDNETHRLQKQARLFNPSTRRMAIEAGIAPGMKVLDVGSGAGDVALLLADLVGPEGRVVGVDRNSALLDTARARVAAAGARNVSFVAADIAQVALDQDFDAAVGRCVLFFVPDPVAVVRRVADAVRPGGAVAFQEPGNAALAPVAVPASPLLERMWGWIMELYRRAGMDAQMGLRLFPIFVEAGLPAPEMHLDAAVGGDEEWAGYDYMASLVRTLLPLFHQHGVATPDEVQVETFADRLRTEVVGQGGVVTTWSFVTAWTRKLDSTVRPPS